MSAVVTSFLGTSAGLAESGLFHRRKGQPDGVGPGIICLHGRGGDATQYSPHSARDFTPGYTFDVLAREGFRLLSVDDNGGTDWGSQDSTARIQSAIAWLQAQGAAKAGKVGIIGWSMGGLACLNWLDQYTAKHACSWLWCPASDLEARVPNPTYTAEINTAYSQEGNRTGNSPAATPANYRGVGPIQIVHAVDDATIPVAESRSFVAAVNDPAVKLKEVAAGGHTALFGYSGVENEIVKFFRDNLGVPAS